MLKAADVAGLVDITYAASTDPARWMLFLERLHRLAHAEIAALFIQDMRTHRGAFSCNYGMAPEWQRAYEQYYSSRNVWMQSAPELNVAGHIRTSEERCSTSALIKTEFYNDFLRRIDVSHGCGGTILREGSLTANVTLLRAGPAFGDQDRRLLRTLIPHLRRAILANRRLAGATLEGQTVLATLDRLPWGVMLADAQARALFVNLAARRIVDVRAGVWIDRGTVSALRPRDTWLLRGAIARAARPGLGGTSMALGRPASRALGIDIVPLALPPATDSPARVVAIFLLDPGRRAERHDRLLARLYDLTPAEAAVAARLGAGDTLNEAAAARAIARETARTHLKNILRKTGTRRQAELVLRLQQAPLRLATQQPAVDDHD
jgi:DNA-binding CsgD family transcriptional regulator